ncbi:MAG: glycoside hydrolase family 18 protein [Roseivirga sp.]|nr:glycoside hydrolase family 18 protein [Roseivirga sp.]
MAYYVPGEVAPTDLPLDKLTHIIFSFTEVVDDQMKFRNATAVDKLKALSAQKKNHPQLKVMVACGGWGGSGGFSEMAADPTKRENFVVSVMSFIDRYDLDGLDMDWEYPGLPGNNNPHLPEDKENFTALMQELREAMDATGKELTLSFASAGWERYYDHIELNEVMKYADYMNVMTYDQVGGGSPVTGHHTNLKSSDASQRSADAIIRFCTEQGVSPGQIVIGAAFYGRSWKGVAPEDNGLDKATNGAWKSAIIYSEIAESYLNKDGFKRYWDETALAPFLYNAKDSLFITYDDPQSVALKTKYAKENKLGGIMFWQLTQDTPSGDLLNAIKKAAEN